MEYQRPVISIHGDKFWVDFVFDVLHLLSDQDKVLPFYQMEYPGDSGYHRLFYDTKAQERYITPEKFDRLPEHVIYVEIPVKERLDLVAASRYIGYRDSEIYPPFFAENLIEKEARVLPRVSLAGDEFFLDARQRLFIDSLNIQNRIPFSKIFIAKTGEIYIDYAPQIRNIIPPETLLAPGTKSTVVKLDPIKKIDPKGWAIMQQPDGPTETKDVIKRKIWKAFGREQANEKKGQFRKKHR